MDYLSVKEVAEIKGFSDRYIKKCCKMGKIKAVKQPHPQNKCMCYMIPISELEPKEQVAYYKGKGTSPPSELLEKAEKEHLKYGIKASEKTIQAFPQSKKDRIEKEIKIIEEWHEERSKEKNKAKFDKEFIEKKNKEFPDLHLSIKRLYKMYYSYKQEIYEGFVDNRGGGNKNKGKLDEEGEFHFLWKQFRTLYMEDSQPSVSRCYQTVVNMLRNERPDFDISKVPSERTFRRKLESIPEAAVVEARNGEKAMRDKFIPRVRRNYSNINANDIWIMDNYTFDSFVIGDDGNIKRLYLTGIQDAKSGVFVDYNITDSPDSQSTVSAIFKAILEHGKPKAIYVDNGSEFCTYDLFGRGCRETSKSKEETRPPSIIEKLGIEGMIAKPRTPQSKAIERTHRTISDQFCRSLRGFCGGTVSERPESLNKRKKSGDIETEEEFRKLFNSYINFDYNQQKYGGSEQKFKKKNMTRMDVWNESIVTQEVDFFTVDMLKFLMLRNAGYQKIKKDGLFVTFHGEKIWYYDEFETWQHIGEKVCVRYNPADPSEIRIYDMEDRYLWTWKCSDKMILNIMNESNENIREAMRIEKSVEKQIKEYLSDIRKGSSDNGSFNIDGIHRIDMIIQNAKIGEKSKTAEKPKNIILHSNDEEQGQLKKAAGCETVTFDIDRVNNNLRGVKK